MAKKIALSLQKGGVGKTTTSVCLAFGLVKKGYKVLLVDADQQAHSTTYCGFYAKEDIEFTLSDILYGTMNNDDIDFSKIILHHEEGLDLIPANSTLENCKKEINNAYMRELILKRALSSLEDIYDYIIIDCETAYSILTVNVMSYADFIIIPTTSEFLSDNSISDTLNSITPIQKQINPDLRVAGVVINKINQSYREAKNNAAIAKELILGANPNVNVFEHFVPAYKAIADNPASGISIYEYDKQAGKVYMDFVDEVLKVTA